MEKKQKTKLWTSEAKDQTPKPHPSPPQTPLLFWRYPLRMGGYFSWGGAGSSNRGLWADSPGRKKRAERSGRSHKNVLTSPFFPTTPSAHPLLCSLIGTFFSFFTFFSWRCQTTQRCGEPFYNPPYPPLKGGEEKKEPLFYNPPSPPLKGGEEKKEPLF